MAIGSLTTGATQGGAIMQIVARGAADFHLTGAARVTFWRLRHTTHSNFATEMIQQSFNTVVQFGGPSASLTLNRTGDLIHRQYVAIDLPGLYPRVVAGTITTYAWVLDSLAASGGGDYMPDPELQAGLTNPLGGYYAHWTNAVGFALLKSVRLIVGSHVIDTLFRDYLYMFEELTGKAGKRLQDMIGKFESKEQLIAYSRRPQRLYVPLPFWYHQVAGNALSLVSLSFHGVQLSVEFEELRNLIIVSNRDIKVYRTNADGTDSGIEVASTDLQACMLTEYVYLDIAERNRFSEGLFDQLIHTVQCRQEQHQSGASPQLQLLFNHPVSEIIFACRLKANEMANRWFDFSRVGPSQGSGGSTTTHPTKVALQPQTEGTFDIIVEPETIGAGEDWADAAAGTSPNLVSDLGMYNLGDVVTVNADPIIEVGLRVNNLNRFSPMEGQFFRQVMPYQHHTNIPKGFIYCYSFALFPEEPNPSGALNFSRLDNVVLDLTLHADIVGQEVTIMVFARNWNVFSYVDGIGGNKFQS
jgi:hypothetical protein